MAYHLELPLELTTRRYRYDTSHILPVQEDFTFDKEPKAILDREIRQLRNKQVPLVKVFWQHHSMEEATWELESTIRVHYPQLLSSGKFRGRNLF